MKVLHVSCEGLGNGGVQSVIMNTCRTFTGKSDIILFTKEKRYYDEEFQSLGGKIYRLPNYEGRNNLRKKLDYYIRFIRILKGTYKILKEHGPYDAIHCHNELESGICNLAAYFAGVKVRISHAHTSNLGISKNNPIAYYYKKFLQKLTNRVSNIKIGCSLEASVSTFGTDVKTLLIPNPIDTSFFKRKVEINPYNNDQDQRIVHIGKFTKNKNQLFLIEILPIILGEYSNVKLQLVGYGDEYRELVESKVLSLGLEKHVEFLPSDSNIKEILQNSSLFMFPSLHEGFGISLLEAQSMELPCLVSESVPKLVDCGLCIYLPLNKMVWAGKVSDILAGKHNLKLDVTKLHSFDIKEYSNKISTLYRGEKYENRHTNLPSSE
ncbi:glycosyltransferase [Bacillus sp. EB01]|uniref:glycosyltransferase n=1 Tax=Bacillus sp. EB01 TaxID=1347086 RepID=UPI0005C4F1EF|nr:glycosyltransferase [Bacillus sp. EB01]